MDKKLKRELFKENCLAAEMRDERALEIVRAVSKESGKVGRKGVKVRIIYKNGKYKDYRTISECARHTGKSETGIKYCLDHRTKDKLGRRFEFVEEDD
ncbi:hypothetical protein [Candidatus Enterococcus clewellii]|uniref:Uncharacterized protein n=1 Tax=Candidatus Enterococcus clewellii TaxID=1834193 RepID=A0A242K869_9ENTE|nr:hypothetical protein [Enterococcus sp. 9E7_DIV0242]OTP17269.1 hypothetical protein A5888_001407 [Enterococcus sp. 9E7_DIV0242]